MIEINDKDVRLVEILEVISQHCRAIDDCDECIFQSTICAREIPLAWGVDLLKESIKERL